MWCRELYIFVYILFIYIYSQQFWYRTKRTGNILPEPWSHLGIWLRLYLISTQKVLKYTIYSTAHITHIYAYESPGITLFQLCLDRYILLTDWDVCGIQRKPMCVCRAWNIFHGTMILYENKKPNGLTSSAWTFTLGPEIGPMGHIIGLHLNCPQWAFKYKNDA